MAELFKAQLDYVFFLYGLAFVVLGAVCFALGDRRPRDLPWRALVAFGLAQGAHEWVVLAALSAGDTPAFLWARLVVLAGSFLPLAEFARLGAARLGRKVPGRWIHAPALLLVALAAVAIGPAAGDAVARYALGCTGGVAAGAVLALLARELAGAEKRWILLAATGLGLYGVAAGAVVPAATPYSSYAACSPPGWRSRSGASGASASSRIIRPPTPGRCDCSSPGPRSRSRRRSVRAGR